MTDSISSVSRGRSPFLLVLLAATTLFGGCQRPLEKPSARERPWQDSLASALETQFDDAWHNLGYDRYSCLVRRGDALLGADAFDSVSARVRKMVMSRKTESELRRRDSLLTGDHPTPWEWQPWCRQVDSLWYATMRQRTRSR